MYICERFSALWNKFFGRHYQTPYYKKNWHEVVLVNGDYGPVAVDSFVDESTPAIDLLEVLDSLITNNGLSKQELIDWLNKPTA